MSKRIEIVEAGAGETLNVLGAPMIVKTDGATGVFLAEQPVPPGYMVPLHVHAEDDEILYVLEGELTLMSDEGECLARPGTVVCLPAGARHGFRNDSDATAHFLVIARPGLQAAEMFRHLDRAAPQAPEAIGAITAQYGVTIG